MAETQKTVPVTFRCGEEVIEAIDKQAKETSQSRTDVIVELILSSIFTVKVTERSKLPSEPGIYFVFTPDKKLLYFGKADNLQVRWNSHHKYQYFIESSLESRIGYFTLESEDQFGELLGDFDKESIATPRENTLVTRGEHNELKSELYAMKRQFQITFDSLASMGLEDTIKRFEALKPPKGRQKWTSTSEDRSEGITRSALMKQFGFGSTEELDKAAAFYSKSGEQYLEELSGWQPKAEEGAKGRFYPPRTPNPSATSPKPSN